MFTTILSKRVHYHPLKTCLLLISQNTFTVNILKHIYCLPQKANTHLLMRYVSAMKTTTPVKTTAPITPPTITDEWSAKLKKDKWTIYYSTYLAIDHSEI